MNEAMTSVPQTTPTPQHRVGFRHRMLIYFAVWLLAVLAIQVFLRPMGLTETALTPIQQRIRWPLYTPFMAVIGLAQAVTWPASPQALAGIAAVTIFALHALLMLTRTRRYSFVVLAVVQVLLLAVAVIYYVRWSELPTGP